MKQVWKNRKLFIILIWIAFLSAIGILFFTFENRLYDSSAKEKLIEQADGITRQLPEIIENDYCAQTTALQIMLSKLKSLALVLETYDNIEDARPFIDAFVENADVSNIEIFDRQGNSLYRRGDNLSKNSIYTEDYVNLILDTKIYEAVADDMGYREDMFDPLFIESSTVEDYLNFFWGVGDKWLITMNNTLSESQKNVETFFSWSNILKGIKIGRTGFMLSFDPELENIILCPNEDLIGSPISAMNMQADKPLTTVEEIRALFGEPNRIVKLKIDGNWCYSMMLEVDSVLLQVVLPLSEIRGNVNRSFFTLYFLLLLVTGLCLIYALIHVNDPDAVIKDKGRFGWNKTQAGKLNFISVIAIAGVFLIGVYLQALSVHADLFNYNFKVDEIVKVSRANSEALEELQTWCDKEAVTKSQMVKTILTNMDKEDVDWEFMEKLFDALSIRYLYIFDIDGNIIATNSPYDRIVLDDSSPFGELLQGRPYLVQNPEEDPVSGELLQKVGVSLRDENNRTNGCILLSVIPGELETIKKNLGFEDIFDQIGLMDETVVVVVNNLDSTIEYMARIEDGQYNSNIAALDYIGKDISAVGLDSQWLKDDFNGTMFLLKNRYFSSVRQAGNQFYLVMRPKIGLEFSDLIPAFIVTATTMVFLLQLLLFSCIEKNPEKREEENEKEKQAEEEKQQEESKSNDDVVTMINKLLYKEKPYFEERWPDDCKKWKDKTEEEKFSKLSKLVLLFLIVVESLHTLVSKESSVWYYCLKGNWGTGINLYSITTCVITICMMFVAKMILHKILFVTARAVGSRGETICHLLDNFLAYALVIGGFFVCLHNLGASNTTLSLTGGVAGVIFGIGCQNIVADILAGIIMAFEGVVHVGDFVQFNDQYAIVLNIGVRTTELKWFGEITVIRNNDFKNYINRPAAEEDRVTTSLDIDLKESLEKVEAILEKELPVIHDRISKKIDDEIRGPEYRGVNEITNNAVRLGFCIYGKGLYKAHLVRVLNGELKKMCERNGITIAMSQVVVNEPRKYPETCQSCQEKKG